MTEIISQKKNEKAEKGGKIALILCIVVILVLAGVISYLLLHQSGGEERTKREVVVNEENAEKVAAEMVEKERVPVGSYQVTMNSTWNFADGTAVSDNAYVENAEANTNAVYFDVVRSDTEETILESPILPVGTHLDEITLDSDLAAGSYDCVLTYYLLDDDDEPVSKVNVGLTIVIEQ